MGDHAGAHQSRDDHEESGHERQHTPGETGLRRPNGDSRTSSKTAPLVIAATRSVGQPSLTSKAEAVSNTAADSAIPKAAQRPARVSGGVGVSTRMRARNGTRCVKRSAAKVAMIDS